MYVWAQIWRPWITLLMHGRSLAYRAHIACWRKVPALPVAVVDAATLLMVSTAVNAVLDAVLAAFKNVLKDPVPIWVSTGPHIRIDEFTCWCVERASVKSKVATHNSAL